MGKAVTDGILDGTLDNIAACTRISVLAAEPTSIAGGAPDITTNPLATTALTAGDFSKANGDTNGRKVTVAQQTDVSISNSGSATHVAVDDGTDWYVTTCTSQTLTAGGTVTIPSWDIEIADPT